MFPWKLLFHNPDKKPGAGVKMFCKPRRHKDKYIHIFITEQKKYG